MKKREPIFNEGAGIVGAVAIIGIIGFIIAIAMMLYDSPPNLKPPQCATDEARLWDTTGWWCVPARRPSSMQPKEKI